MTKSAVFYALILVFITACKSYSPNANIEADCLPVTNETNEDPKLFVEKTLKLMYPNIGKFILEDKVDEYEVNFTIGGSHFKVTFDLSGNWKKSKVEIRYVNKINENVKEAIRNSEYRKMRIVKKELEEKPGIKEYYFFFQEGGTVYKIKYNQYGKVIKSETKSVELLK